MKRITSAATAAAGAVLLAAIALAPAAHAASVSNPADNPHEISVEGDDGKTYTDGLDTLPGFDDYECTYIPGAWFDFENNRVNYADGQSIPWTEWSRATGYEAWKANRNKPSSGGSSNPTKTSKPSTGKPSSGGTPSSGKSASTGKSTTGKSSTSGTSTSGDPGANVNRASSTVVSSGAGSTPSATSSAAATPGATASAPAPGASANSSAPELDGTQSIAPGVTGDIADSTLVASASSGGRSAAGVLILVGLAALGALAFAGRPIFARLSRRGSAS